MPHNQLNEALFSEFVPVSNQAWNEQLKADLKTDQPESKLNWKTQEGLVLKAIYRADDLDQLQYLESMPGQFPFLRGNKVHNHWQINRIIETAEPSKANELALRAIQRGAQSVEFNCSQVKKYNELGTLLHGIDLEKVSVRFDKPMSYKIILVHLIKYVEEKGFDKSKISGSFNWDAMAYRLISGQYYQTLDDNIDELKGLLEQVDLHFPNFKVLTINAQHFHNGGATTLQELAFTLSAAVEYVQRLLQKGFSLPNLLPRMMFRMAIGSAYFVEIAKFRAFRFLWAQVVSSYDAELKAQSKTCIFALNGLYNKSVYDPYVNMLRTTTETMSAAIGGVDILSNLAFDAPYKFESEFSSRIAQNQQILIKEEAHFDKVVDPAAGSYYIENITDSYIQHAWNSFVELEEAGGFAKAMESDFIKKELAKSAQSKQFEAATRRTNILGTNQFSNQNEFMLPEIEKPAKSPAPGVHLHRLSEGYEQLRLETEVFSQKHGSAPKVLMLSFGSLSMRKARAAFISNFFACAGYTIFEMEDCSSPEIGMKQALEMKAQIVVLCSADEEYLAFVQQMAGIKKLLPNALLMIAGNPTENIDDLKRLGVDDFIHLKTNVLERLKALNKKLLS